MKLYGHRGAAGERRENTLEAFAHANALGLAGVETDIAITADGVPVLHHDPHLADGRLIRATTLADLPPHIPTLAQGLAAAPELHWLLEIKTFPDQPESCAPPALAAASTIAVLRGVPDLSASILAFDWAVLRAVRDLAPELPRLCLTAPETQAARALWWGLWVHGHPRGGSRNWCYRLGGLPRHAHRAASGASQAPGPRTLCLDGERANRVGAPRAVCGRYHYGPSIAFFTTRVRHFSL